MVLKVGAHLLSRLVVRQVQDELGSDDDRAAVRAQYLEVRRHRVRCAGRIAIIDGDTLTVKATWWQRLCYRKVTRGKLKGQPIPGSVDIPLHAVTRAVWRSGTGPNRRAQFLVDAPGYNDRWCLRGRWGRERPHKLKVGPRRWGALSWIAMGVWLVREDLAPGIPRGPRRAQVHGGPTMVKPVGGVARSLRTDPPRTRRGDAAQTVVGRS